MRFFKYTVYLC